MSFRWHRFGFSFKKEIMVVPFIALIVIIIAVVYFLVKAGKKNSHGRDLGEPGKGTI
jgi:hypothetical protein